jgi:serine/threonine protein kinase
MKNEI